MVLVGRMRDQFLAFHHSREFLPVRLAKAVDPDFTVGTWIGIARAGGGMAVAKPTHLVPVLHNAESAVDRRHTDVEHRDFDFPPLTRPLALEHHREDAGG